MSDVYGEMYYERLKQRFAALADTPVWDSINSIFNDLLEQEDAGGLTGLHEVCVRLSEAQGLSFGPRLCGSCGHELEGDFGPDSATCPACLARF